MIIKLAQAAWWDAWDFAASAIAVATGRDRHRGGGQLSGRWHVERFRAYHRRGVCVARYGEPGWRPAPCACGCARRAI